LTPGIRHWIESISHYLWNVLSARTLHNHSIFATPVIERADNGAV
jgi:hypothetical protein